MSSGREHLIELAGNPSPISAFVQLCRCVKTKLELNCLRALGVGGGDSRLKRSGMLIGNFRFRPLGGTKKGVVQFVFTPERSKKTAAYGIGISDTGAPLAIPCQH